MEYQAVVKMCQQERGGLDSFLLELELGSNVNFNAGPGQFIILEPLNNRSVMPRPFSVVDVNGNIVSVLIKVIGKNTRAYSELQPGEVIKIIGPQGLIIQTELMKSYILVGGGIGGAALILLAKELTRQRISFKVLLGARDEKQISGIDFFNKYGAQVLTITETDGERTGLITDLLEEIIAEDNGLSTIVACGPKPMLQKVSEMSVEFGNKCLIMLEEVMACGMGSCKGCALVGKGGNKHVCTDGPAIDAEWIDWPEFMLTPVIKSIKSKPLERDAMKVNLGNLQFDYPVINGAGCLAVDALEKSFFDYSKLGALVTKGVTVSARSGNKMPRVCETPAGMINSIGLENVGIQKFLQEELPRWLKLGKPILVNISGFSIEEYVELAQSMSDTDIAGVEVNISCPNVKEGVITFGVDPALAYLVVSAVRRVTDKIVITKLTPNVTDIANIAKAVVDAGTDAISLINTVQAMAIDVMTRRPKIGTIIGGLSGPAIRPVAVYMVHQIYQANLGVPIIGMGGIEDGKSAAEFFMAGANMIAVGTGGFINRRIFNQINDELEEIIKHHGFSSIDELVGSMIIN